MNLRRLFSPILLLIMFLAAPLYLYSLDTDFRSSVTGCGNVWLTGYRQNDFSPFINKSDTSALFDEHVAADTRMIIVKTPTDGGIKEDIPEKYRDRFEKWKTEFLVTDFGREEWNKYADNKQFILTITISNKRGKGAGTDKYLWDDTGNFVGATITLGDELNEGYPNPIYYPVMNSLSSGDTSYSISGKILAAAKISHEIGHVNHTAKANRAFLQLQNNLMPV